MDVVVVRMDVNSINDLEYMELFLSKEIQEIEDKVDYLVELAHTKGEKLKKVQELVEEYKRIINGEGE
jgi:hypothetical protein